MCRKYHLKTLHLVVPRDKECNHSPNDEENIVQISVTCKTKERKKSKRKKKLQIERNVHSIYIKT